MKFVKVMDKFVEIHRDNYNLHKIKLYLKKILMIWNMRII